MGDFLTEEEYRKFKEEENKALEETRKAYQWLLPHRRQYADAVRNSAKTELSRETVLLDSTQESVCQQLSTFAKHAYDRFGNYSFQGRNTGCSLTYKLRPSNEVSSKDPPSQDLLTEAEYKEVEEILTKGSYASQRVLKRLENNHKSVLDDLHYNFKSSGLIFSRSILSSTNERECKDMEIFVTEAKPKYGEYKFYWNHSILRDPDRCHISFSMK